MRYTWHEARPGGGALIMMTTTLFRLDSVLAKQDRTLQTASCIHTFADSDMPLLIKCKYLHNEHAAGGKKGKANRIEHSGQRAGVRLRREQNNKNPIFENKKSAMWNLSIRCPTAAHWLGENKMVIDERMGRMIALLLCAMTEMTMVLRAALSLFRLPKPTRPIAATDPRASSYTGEKPTKKGEIFSPFSSDKCHVSAFYFFFWLLSDHQSQTVVTVLFFVVPDGSPHLSLFSRNESSLAVASSSRKRKNS
ncbi:hypothetical protein BX070DRAFT_4299 [Coemansia spiralis]|nr:hypothetical protein BX070DRAFT_4299 [Coemansia spiralis]